MQSRILWLKFLVVILNGLCLKWEKSCGSILMLRPQRSDKALSKPNVGYNFSHCNNGDKRSIVYSRVYGLYIALVRQTQRYMIVYIPCK